MIIAQAHVLETFMELERVVQQQYSADELMIIGYPTADQVSALFIA